jgi:tetratricopeptide (TPR) repeat protein/DNA-binding CsgD family transcriptional regulator
MPDPSLIAETSAQTHLADLPPSHERLVGRHVELARILKMLEIVATTGVGRMVLVSGEPGIGKTRLAREVLTRAGTAGARACLGRSFEQHAGVPFFLFTEALTLPLIGPPLLPQAKAMQRWPQLARLLPEATAEQLRQDSGENQLQVFRAVTAFLHAVSGPSPLVLLLDDLHWADATSMSLLLYLARHLAGAHVLIVGTYRNIAVGRHSPLSEIVSELVRERLAEEVTLRRLPLDETAELLQSRLGNAKVSHELVQLVHGRAEGNPFFTEELISALTEQGVVSQIGGVWDYEPDSEIDVPRSIRSVIDQRVRRLAPDVQDLLQLGSVVGQAFELDVLLAASGPESAVLSELDTALASGLINEESERKSERYRFAHTLIQQTLYSGLPTHRRRALHRRVAEGLQMLAGRRSVLSAELSRHFLAAGERQRALSYGIEAGDQAAGQYAHAEAAGHFQTALDHLIEMGDTARAADIQHRLARELYDLNRVDEALDAYHAALGRYEFVNDRMGQALVHRGIGLLHDGRYEMAAAVSHFNAALQLWPPDREDATLGWLLMEASRAAFYSGDPTGGLALAERSLALAERCGDPGLLARALGRAANNRTIQDARPSAALKLLDRAERVARSSNDSRALSRGYLSRADQHSAAGDWDLALADRRRAIESAQRSGETERLMFAYENVAETYMFTGDWREGRNAARTGLELDPRGYLKGAYARHELAWMEGKPDEALRLVRAHIADARHRADVQGVALNLVLLADFSLQLDRATEAEAPAREAAEFLRVGGQWQPWPGIFCGVLAETVVQVASPDMDDMLAEMEEMVATTEQFAARPQLLRARGLLLERRGRLYEAVEALTESAEVARDQHAGIQLGRTLDALIRIARQRGDVSVATEAQAELDELVHRIGPEVSVLAWARRVATAPARTAVQRGRPATGALARLTPREREVAALVARGLTNHQIAEALVIADGTAGVHIDHILSKLGFRSRAQVAAWAVEHGLPASPD